MSHIAKKADDRFVSITWGITKWLPSNSHSTINMVSVVECRVVGLPFENDCICIFLLVFWKNRYVFPGFDAITMAFCTAVP